PTGIALSNATVAENLPAGTVVGTLRTTDPDSNDTFRYDLVDGIWATHNASFTIDPDGTLKTTTSLDREAGTLRFIRVRSTDAGGLSIERVFTIEVFNVNEAPTNLTLSEASIAEDQPAGSTVGFLGATDPDLGDTLTYSLVEGTGSVDNASFQI